MDGRTFFSSIPWIGPDTNPASLSPLYTTIIRTEPLPTSRNKLDSRSNCTAWDAPWATMTTTGMQTSTSQRSGRTISFTIWVTASLRMSLQKRVLPARDFLPVQCGSIMTMTASSIYLSHTTSTGALRPTSIARSTEKINLIARRSTIKERVAHSSATKAMEPSRM